MLRKRDFDETTLGAIIDGRTPIKKGIFKWMKLNNELNLTIRNILMKDIYKKISHIYKKINISFQWSLSIPKNSLMFSGNIKRGQCCEMASSFKLLTELIKNNNRLKNLID